jgi:dTDP-4-dehydrorhamnose 3,5-epimerase-like enzyme
MSRPEVLAAGHAVTKAPETNIVRMITGKIWLGVFFIRSSLIWFYK